MILWIETVGVAGFEPTTSWSQTRRDNRTTLHPEKSINKYAERLGLEPRRQLPADRLAICSVTTPAPLLNHNYKFTITNNSSYLRVQRYNFFLYLQIF